MKQRRVGNSGVMVSEIGIGVWSLVTDWWGRGDKAEEIIEYALMNGINFFDTADSYGNGRGEELLGRTIGQRRDEAVILTKIGYDIYHHEAGQREIPQNFSLDYLEQALRNSLKRLNRDYVDILMLHNPRLDTIMNTEVFRWLEGVKRDGYARVIGVSLGPTLGWEEEGLAAIRMGYGAMEYIYNIIEQRPGESFLTSPGAENVGHFIRVPHASDALDDDKWPIINSRGLHRSFKDIEWIERAVNGAKKLIPTAEAIGMKLSQLSLAFVLSSSRVTSVMPNITTKNDIDKYVAVEGKELSEEVIAEIREVYESDFRILNEESIRETDRYRKPREK